MYGIQRGRNPAENRYKQVAYSQHSLPYLAKKCTSALKKQKINEKMLVNKTIAAKVKPK